MGGEAARETGTDSEWEWVCDALEGGSGVRCVLLELLLNIMGGVVSEGVRPPLDSGGNVELPCRVCGWMGVIPNATRTE